MPPISVRGEYARARCSRLVESFVRKRVQRANIDVTHGVTFTGTTVVKCPVAMMGRG